LKIAVIDDEQGIRNLLRDVLECEGYDVVDAQNGVSGLEIIRSSVPDLIVCDINMPVMNGDEVFQTLRDNEPELALIPFIFLSGNIDADEEIKRLNQGADNCFQKPVDMNLFVAHVNSQLQRVTRVSQFLNQKLDRIALSLPDAIERDFPAYKSLTMNVHGYIDAIVNAVTNYFNEVSEHPGKDNSIATSQSLPADNMVLDELAYVRYCLESFKERRLLVRASNGEDLSWTLIFMVIQAQMEDLIIYVSDLYVSIPAAKSTINARISSLIDDGVFIKENDLADGRRQKLFLTDSFRTKLMHHISTNIALVNRI